MRFPPDRRMVQEGGRSRKRSSCSSLELPARRTTIQPHRAHWTEGPTLKEFSLAALLLLPREFLPCFRVPSRAPRDALQAFRAAHVVFCDRPSRTPRLSPCGGPPLPCGVRRADGALAQPACAPWGSLRWWCCSTGARESQALGQSQCSAGQGRGRSREVLLRRQIFVGS